MLNSYILDIPEAEEMLSVKRGVIASSLFHNCVDSEDNMQYWGISHRLTLAIMKKLMSMPNSEEWSHFNVVEKTKQRSMMSILPVLSTFPPLEVQRCVYIYFIFQFEPKNSLSLGDSKG